MKITKKDVKKCCKTLIVIPPSSKKERFIYKAIEHSPSFWTLYKKSTYNQLTKKEQKEWCKRVRDIARKYAAIDGYEWKYVKEEDGVFVDTHKDEAPEVAVYKQDELGLAQWFASFDPSVSEEFLFDFIILCKRHDARLEKITVEQYMKDKGLKVLPENLYIDTDYVCASCGQEHINNENAMCGSCGEDDWEIDGLVDDVVRFFAFAVDEYANRNTEGVMDVAMDVQFRIGSGYGKRDIVDSAKELGYID